MAKDFFAQYLALKQGGAQVTSDQALQIAQNTLSSPEYTQANGAVYTVANLHVSTETNPTLIQKYKAAIGQSFKDHDSKKMGDELTILGNAVKDQNPAELDALDPIIAADKAIMNDFLAMTIPADAVTVHLAFLNAASNILANTEGVRVTFTDPVRSFAATSQFKQHAQDVKVALVNLDTYFKSHNQ